MNATIIGKNLVRGFGEGSLRTVALQDVSLKLSTGEMTVLMGPSGSGKSTLLAILSGLLRPDSGQVEVMGTDLWQQSETQRERFRRDHCGFIFQGYNLFPALTAIQQLEIVLNWSGQMVGKAARDKSLETLKTLGLGDRAHLRPQQLSGGEKQRVAVARALVKHPSLIFADEPTAALDWQHGEQVVRMLHHAAHELNATVLLVSHDPRIVPLADRVFHLEDGRLAEHTIESMAEFS
jgi:putative ABC transport system ATP-binding protein